MGPLLIRLPRLLLFLVAADMTHVRTSPFSPPSNAACESFIKTLKYEEVYRTEYRDLIDARASIGAFLGKVYNQKRLHSALGYRPPAEFERGWLAQTKKGGRSAASFLYEFSQAWGNLSFR